MPGGHVLKLPKQKPASAAMNWVPKTGQSARPGGRHSQRTCMTWTAAN